MYVLDKFGAFRAFWSLRRTGAENNKLGKLLDMVSTDAKLFGADTHRVYSNLHVAFNKFQEIEEWLKVSTICNQVFFVF